MKQKLLSLLLAAGMLASLCAPGACALPAGGADAEPPAAVTEAATSETADEDLTDEAPADEEPADGEPAETPADGDPAATPGSVSPSAVSMLAAPAAPQQKATAEPAISFHVTTADGIDYTGADPFGRMALVVGKAYTFQLLLDGQPLQESGLKLDPYGSDDPIQYHPNGNLSYLEVSGIDAEKGTFTLKATQPSGSNTPLGNLEFRLYNAETGTTTPRWVPCIGTTVADTGRAQFVDTATGAPVAELEASAEKRKFKLSLTGCALDSNTMEIEYGSTVPDSVSITTEGQEFGKVELTVNRALSSDASFYAIVKNRETGEVLTSATVSLKWVTPTKADTLPGGDTIYFGAKSDESYSHWYEAEYNQVAGSTQTGTLQVFFGTTREDGYTKDYTDQPLTGTVTGIEVTSLTPETVTVLSQTPATADEPFTFQYQVQLGQCATAQLQAAVTLDNGQTCTALFTINVVENLAVKETTVNNADELQAALADVRLTPGSTIYLENGTYEGNFAVNTPVQLIAANYNGTADLYDAQTGAPLQRGTAVIKGTITANAENVEVYGLSFQCPEGETNTTALTDACAVSGCTFTGYETALELAKTVQNTSNYRVVKNVFKGNDTALRFAGREWLSNVQQNSFLNNDAALALDAGAYVDGVPSKVYGATVNGGKWTGNFFRGTAGQTVLQDGRTNKDATLLLNYNYYEYDGTVGAEPGLFVDAKADYSVFYTTPELAAVRTSVNLETLAQTDGLNLVAQQDGDNALNVSGQLFDDLKAANADALTLKVWTADEDLAATWTFPKADLAQTTTDVNLGVDAELSNEETSVVDAKLPAGVAAQTVSFAHSGALPGKATVQVPLTESDLPTGEDLGLYYIDPNTGALELQETDVAVTNGNLQFTIEHCSSYLVAAKDAIPQTPDTPDTPDTPAEPGTSSGSGTSGSASAAPAPSAPAAADGTVYYTCPACGTHNWTATAAGYRCDNCGKLESLKQLSGYGNVKGLYTPQTGAAAAAAIPQTGDESAPALWLALLAASGLALGGLLRRRQSGR